MEEMEEVSCVGPGRGGLGVSYIFFRGYLARIIPVSSGKSGGTGRSGIEGGRATRRVRSYRRNACRSRRFFTLKTKKISTFVCFQRISRKSVCRDERRTEIPYSFGDREGKRVRYLSFDLIKADCTWLEVLLYSYGEFSCIKVGKRIVLTYTILLLVQKTRLMHEICAIYSTCVV